MMDNATTMTLTEAQEKRDMFVEHASKVINSSVVANAMLEKTTSLQQIALSNVYKPLLRQSYQAYQTAKQVNNHQALFELEQLMGHLCRILPINAQKFTQFRNLKKARFQKVKQLPTQKNCADDIIYFQQVSQTTLYQPFKAATESPQRNDLYDLLKNEFDGKSHYQELFHKYLCFGATAKYTSEELNTIKSVCGERLTKIIIPDETRLGYEVEWTYRTKYLQQPKTVKLLMQDPLDLEAHREVGFIVCDNDTDYELAPFFVKDKDYQEALAFIQAFKDDITALEQIAQHLSGHQNTLMKNIGFSLMLLAVVFMVISTLVITIPQLTTLFAPMLQALSLQGLQGLVTSIGSAFGFAAGSQAVQAGSLVLTSAITTLLAATGCVTWWCGQATGFAKATEQTAATVRQVCKVPAESRWKLWSNNSKSDTKETNKDEAGNTAAP